MEHVFAAGPGRLSIPKAFGGEQASLIVISDVLTPISAYDASLSWQICVQAAMGRLSDYLSDEAAEEIYGTPGRFAIGSIHAGGSAVPDGDGYRLSGRWSFASGSRHADWLVCTVKLEDGSGETRMFFVPATQCEVLDTWDTLGMCGTGSNDFSGKDIWASKRLSVDAATLQKPPESRHSRGYHIGYYDFGTIAAMSTVFGIAVAALENFRENRKAGSDDHVNGVVEKKVGRAVAKLYAARLMLTDAVAQAMAPTEGTRSGTHPRVAVAAATITENAAKVVNEVLLLAGSSAVFKGNFIEGCFGDIHTGSKHFTLSPQQFQRFGARYLEQRAPL
jgi:alkylation response protein AidB-like acyl-CoA dehydrogenase